jgi:hypothetical protein
MADTRLNDLSKAFALEHRLGHDRPDVPEVYRAKFREIARRLWNSLKETK